MAEIVSTSSNSASTYNTRLKGKSASTSSLLTMESSRNYKLDPQKAMENKKESCNKEHISAVWKHGNLIIEFSTAAYELAKEYTINYLECSKTYRGVMIDGKDQGHVVPDSCIKVCNRLKDGTAGRIGKFVINMYHTRCKLMINGNRIDLFVTDIYKGICQNIASLHEDLTIMNRGLFNTIEEASLQMQTQLPNIEAEDEQPVTLFHLPGYKAITEGTHQNPQPQDMAQPEIQELSNDTGECTTFCPICHEETIKDVTIECTKCLEWVHQSCTSIKDLGGIEDKDFICRICTDDLIYKSIPTNRSDNRVGNSVEKDEEEDTIPKQPFTCSLVPPSPNRIASKSIHKNKMAAIESQIAVTHGTIQNDAPSTSANTANIDNNKHEVLYSDGPAAKPKVKRPAMKTTSKPQKDNYSEKAYIGQLENEIEHLKSTVELMQKAHSLQQKNNIGHQNCASNNLANDQCNTNSNIQNQQQYELRFLDLRMKQMEMQMTQNMQMMQLQHMQMMSQLQNTCMIQQNHHITQPTCMAFLPRTTPHMLPPQPIHPGIRQWQPPMYQSHLPHPMYPTQTHPIHQGYVQPQQVQVLQPPPYMVPPRIERNNVQQAPIQRNTENNMTRGPLNPPVPTAVHTHPSMNRPCRNNQNFQKQDYVPQSTTIRRKEDENITTPNYNDTKRETQNTVVTVPNTNLTWRQDEDTPRETAEERQLAEQHKELNTDKEIYQTIADNNIAVKNNQNQETKEIQQRTMKTAQSDLSKYETLKGKGEKENSSENHFLESAPSPKEPPEILLLEEINRDRE